MDLKQLEAYVQVIERNSFSKAAETLFISQPSVSLYVRALEKELQTQLLYRSTKEIIPTKAGSVFYEYAKKILTLCDSSVSALQGFADHSVGNIDLLASSVPAQYILPEVLASFHGSYPKISFQLDQADTAEVISGVASGQRDIGFAGARLKNPKCVYDTFLSEHLVLVTPNLPRFRDLSGEEALKALETEPFIAREQGSGTRLRYEAFLQDLGLPPEKLNAVARFNNTQSILHAVTCGLGISIVSELAARQHLKLKMILRQDLSCPMPRRDFYIVMKKDFPLSPAAALFLDFLKTFVRKQDMER